MSILIFVNKGTINTATGFGNIDADYTDAFQTTAPANRTFSAFNNPTTQLQSYFARAILNYDSKYILTATFRADGSTKFGKSNRYGYFPSFAAAWDIKKEAFMSDVAWINQLKLRVGYGKTGNQDFPSGSAQQRYDFGNTNGQPTLIAINNANPNLKWQSDKQTNVGLDFGFLNNKTYRIYRLL